MDKEIKELTQQRDLAQSRIQDLLRSTTERQGSESGVVEKEKHEKHYERLNSSNGNLDFAENAEDGFLLDGTSPRLSIGMSPKLGGPDPLSGWEGAATKTPETNTCLDYDDGAEVICKEVRCIEVDESRPGINDQREQTESKLQENTNEPMKEEHINYPEKDGGIGDFSADATYDSLQKKIHDMQRTINCLASLYPVDRSSASSSDADTTSTVSSKVTRSRSCKTKSVGTPPYPTPEWSDIGFSANLEPSRLNSSSDFENTRRKDSLISVGTSLDFGELDGTDNEKFVAEESKEDADDVQLKQVDDQVRHS